MKVVAYVINKMIVNADHSITLVQVNMCKGRVRAISILERYGSEYCITVIEKH